MFERLGAALGWQSFAESPGDAGRPAPVVVWELRTMEIEYRDRDERKPVSGALPAGYLVLSEQGRIVSAVGCGEADGIAAGGNAALFRGNFPGTGRYRIDHGRLITRAAEGAAGAETVQSRECRLEGARLEVAGAWMPGEGEEPGLRRLVFGFQKMG